MAWKIDQDGVAYFITSTVVDWLPVFNNPSAVAILYRWLNHAVQHEHLCVAAYVVMPTHVHLIVFDEGYQAARLSRTVTAWRKQTGALLAQHLDMVAPIHARRTMRENATENRQRRFWQFGMRPEAINSTKWLNQKAAYLHDNPVRKCLVTAATDWPHSSARFYATGGAGPVPVTPLEL